MSNSKSLTKKAGLVGIATLLSRILGFCRDMGIAGFFGAGMWSDAFLVAFRFPNLFRKLFAEGTLSISFIPIFMEVFEREGRSEAYRMARASIGFLCVVLAGVTFLGIFYSDYLVHIIAPGFSISVVKFELTVKLTRIMFPYVFFICMVALCMGILNALDHFIAPAVAPLILNIAILGAIFGVALVYDGKTERVIGLAYGVLLGGALQLGIQLPVMIKKGIWNPKKIQFFHPALKKVITMVPPSALGAGAFQVNCLVAVLLASTLREGSVTYLYFADRLIQFPLGVFAISLSTVLLPTLSKQAAVNDISALSKTFADALRAIFFITIPSMVGLIVLRDPIVALLFQHGDFDLNAVHLTAQALLAFGLGLWAFAAMRIVVSVFFALQDYKTPVQASISAILINLGLSLALIKNYTHNGLALAVSISSTIHLILLLFILHRRLKGLAWTAIINSFFKSIGCSGLMGVAVWWTAFYIIPQIPRNFFRFQLGDTFLLFQVLVSIIIGVLLYTCAAFMVNSSELKFVLTLKRKGKE